MMPGLPSLWGDGSQQVESIAFNANFGGPSMKRHTHSNLQFNNCFSVPVNAVWSSGGPNTLQPQPWNNMNQNIASHGNSSMNYGSAGWGNQQQGWNFPRPNHGQPLLPNPTKQNRSFSAGDNFRPAKRSKSDHNSEVPNQFMDDEGNEPVTGYMTLTPKGCSPNSLVCRINEDLRSKFGYSGRPVTYSRFCQHYHMLKFPGQWVLSLVIRNLNPLKVGENSVFITECAPQRGPGAAAKSMPASSPSKATAPPRTPAPKASSQPNEPAEIVIDLEASSEPQRLPPVKNLPVDPPLSRRKRKKIQSMEEKRPTNRPRGVFPGGVQPHSIVLLVDQDAPYVSADTLAAKNYRVLTGRNLGPLDYMSLIERDESIHKDGVLFVIIPWLSFALKYFELFPYLAPSDAADAGNKASADAAHVRPSLGNDASTLLNIVKDFQQQLDPQDFLTLTTSESQSSGRNSQSNTEGSPSYVRRILSQRLLYSALLLRSLVRTSYDNCDVVFCGFPAHAMSAAGADKLFRNCPGNPALQIPAFCEHLLAALRVFNEFAANTWRLGYVSKIPSFNCAPEPPRQQSRRSQSPDVEIEILSEVQSSGYEERIPPSKLCRASASQVTLAQQEHSPVTIDEDNEITGRDGDDTTTVSSPNTTTVAVSTKEVAAEDDIAVCEPSMETSDCISPGVGEKSSACEAGGDLSSQIENTNKVLGDNSKTNSELQVDVPETISEASNTAKSVIDENLPEEDANVLCIDNTEVFDDDEEEQSCKKDAEDDDDDADIEIIELPVAAAPVSNTRARRQCDLAGKTQRRSSVSREAVPAPSVQKLTSDTDGSDTDEGSADLCEDEVHDPNSIPLMRLYRHRWFGKRRKVVGERRGAYTNRRTEDTSRWFMERLMQLLRLGLDFARNRGAMVPWEVPVAVPPADGAVPAAVAESLRVGVYEVVTDSSPPQYRCRACRGTVGSTSTADAHAYSWLHCEALTSGGGGRLSSAVTDRLLGRLPLEGAMPLSAEYVERATRCRTLQARGEAFTRCVLCGVTVPRHGLRHHLSCRRHRSLLAASLGLSGDHLLPRHLHWRLYRRLLARHPAMDVVIVTDEVNHSVVQSLARLHSRVTVLSYSDFLRDPAGRVAAVQEWQQRNTEVALVPSGHIPHAITEAGGSSSNDAGHSVESVTATPNKCVSQVEDDAIVVAETEPDEVLVDADCSHSTGQSSNAGAPTANKNISTPVVESVKTAECGEVTKSAATTTLVLDISEDCTDALSVDESAGADCRTEVEATASERTSLTSTPANKNSSSVSETTSRPTMTSTPDANKNSSSVAESEASDGARSVLWLVVAGIDLLIPSDNSEEFADIDEIMSRVYEAHAYLRLHLPPDHLVLTTPVLPLTILEDTLPSHLTSPLMNGSNAIRTSPEKVDKIVQLYKLLFSRSLAVHAANAAHENVFKINKTAVSAEVVKTLTSEQVQQASVCLSAHYIASTPWHVAMESLVGHALYGLPCPYLSRRPAAVKAAAAAGVDIRDMEPVSRLCRAGIVGELKFDRSSSMAYKKVSCHKRWLQFDASDLAFILQLTATASESSPVTWCLTAPFPRIVMQYSPNPSCVVNRCKKGLRLWQFQSAEVNLSSAQLRLRSFLTELQCKLPDGNFANVFPAYPCNFIIIGDKTDEETHQTIHRLHRSMANTFFTRESEDDVRTVFEGLADAWRRIFATNKLGHTLAGDCADVASVAVYQLRESAAVVHRNSKRQVHEWLDAVTRYFGDYCDDIAVQLKQPAETGTDDLIVVE